MQVLTSIDGEEKFIYLIELYKELGVKIPYRAWMDRVLDVEMENVDFWRDWLNDKPIPETELITLETAKSISYAENTERAFAVYGQIGQNDPEKKMDFIKGGLFA